MTLLPPCVRPVSIAVVALGAAVLGWGVGLGSLAAQTDPPPGSVAERAAAEALEHFHAGRHQEAARAYEAIIKNFPTSVQVAEAQFRLGYLHYLLGEYDKSVILLRKTLGPSAPPEIQELGHGLLPRAQAARAASMPANEPRRKVAFEAAIRGFDGFIQKFPHSTEIGAAHYGRALALYHLGNYDAAEESLHENLKRLTHGESILDTQYLYALTLATQANLLAQTQAQAQLPRQPDQPDVNRTRASAKFDSALRYLRDIVQKGTDIALANDAQLQIGEVLFRRAAFAEQPAARAKLLDEAITACRAVQPKDAALRAQEARMEGIRKRIAAELAAKNVPAIRPLQRLLEHENVKLQTLRKRADPSTGALVRIATCYLQQEKFDEARVVLRHAAPHLTAADQKKELLYYLTMTYASQGVAEKATAGYDEFQASFEGDPIAENLPITLGMLFLKPGPKLNNPGKAIRYFEDQTRLYPRSRFTTDAAIHRGIALLRMRQFAAAHDVFKRCLALKPGREHAVAAEFGIATILRETKKTDEAIAAFRRVRDAFAGTPQSEQAQFWIGQTLLEKGDASNAVAELDRYVAAHPQGELVPAALLSLAEACAQNGDDVRALELCKRIAQDFPKSDAAPTAYFQRAALHAQAGQSQEMEDVLRAFIDAHPGSSDRIFLAYDSIGVNQMNEGRISDAAGTYAEMAQRYPEHAQAPHALAQAAELWRQHAESMGHYFALTEQQRSEWNRGVTSSIGAAEQLIFKYPDSRQVALGLQSLLASQRLLLSAKLKTAESMEQDLQGLAEKFSDRPGTRKKVLFTRASFFLEKDRKRTLAELRSAYDPELVYAPEDLDLFGSLLIETGQLEEAMRVYRKLAADYPIPAGTAPEKAPPRVAEAQARALYGIGRTLHQQGRVTEAAGKFEQLQKLYPWSPKRLEADHGIAQALVQQQKLDEAMERLVGIIGAPAATAELRANAMLLGGRIQERRHEQFAEAGRAAEAREALAAAINYYLKIAVFYEAVRDAAAEGLWRGAQLLEKQAGTL